MRPRPLAVRRDPVVSRANLSTPAGHPHAPESEGRNRQSLGSKFSLVHLIPFPLRKISFNINPKSNEAALLSGASAPGKLPGERQVLSVIQGDAVPQKFIPKLIKLHQEGRFSFDRLVKFYDLDIRQLAEVLVVLTIATFTFLNPACALHKFNRLNPFHHFETELVFNPEPQGCAVEFA